MVHGLPRNGTMRTHRPTAAVLAALVIFASGCSLSGPPIRRFVDDLTISKRVRARLVQASPVLAAIDIDTYEGTVYLNGPVETEAAKYQAEELAKTVDDAELVVNNLHVPRAPAASGPGAEDGVPSASAAGS